MAITPTVMIAAKGLLGGEGVGISSTMTDRMTSAKSNPISGGTTSLQSTVSLLNSTPVDDPNYAANIALASSIQSGLSSLPSAFTSVKSVADSVTAQASAMVPDIKSFINLQNSATAFGGVAAQYGAAIAQFGNKSFADLGVGVKGFVDANSGGLTSLVPGLNSLAEKAKKDAFGALGANLDPAALLKGQAQMASSALGDGLKLVGKGLTSFGTLFDFKDPKSMSYQGLVENLQKQGLAESVGINAGISDHGYDPTKLAAIPDSVLKEVLSTVQGMDLAKVISQMGVTKAGTYTTAADLVDPSKIMPPGAVAALGIKPGAGIDGLKSLSNTFTNIGVPLDAASASKLLNGAQTKVGEYLSGLKELVPQDIKTGLGSFLGTGSSPFGTPSMSDMLGSVAGKHAEDFKNAGKQIASIASSSTGLTLSKAMDDLNKAILSGSGIDDALTKFTAASTAFSTQAESNSSLKAAFTSITGSLNKVTSHLSLETSNLSLAGVNLNSLPAVTAGSGSILAFASKLHTFGVDKMQIGHNDVLNGIAQNGLTGDAIKAALLEGKNAAAMTSAGKTPPSVSNQKQALADANAANFDEFIKAYETAESEKASTNAKLQSAKGVFLNLSSASKASPDDAGLSAQAEAAQAAYKVALDEWTIASDAARAARNKMSDAASNTKDLDRSTATIQKYLG